ncbi:Pyridoxal-5'-phosphate phosphatase, Alphaproteobacterial type [hydrothermal vent metagenome]|uniref:Pyridoxal-5'-phosphate phosphatase, Alphaproteobacterial type n=1 Tax=hydrothermal vent metagenome TaxID=652676 RepID=A0A3B1B9J1_9ZZZZ
MNDGYMKHIEHWVFDLDNTLYPAQNNLFSQVDRRMGEFISQRFDLPFEQARARQKKYFKTYGTTLRGLMTEDDVAPQDFLNFVHDIDFDVLQENKDLNEAINNLRGDKVIYTNASRDYAVKVLGKLGLSGGFREIFDINSASFKPKPDPGSYLKMIGDLGINPEKSVMIEDMARNLVPARDLGMKTVWVRTEHECSGPKDSGDGYRADHIDYTTINLAEWLKRTVKD